MFSLAKDSEGKASSQQEGCGEVWGLKGSSSSPSLLGDQIQEPASSDYKIPITEGQKQGYRGNGKETEGLLDISDCAAASATML